MTQTINRLIQTVFNEFSSQRIDRFTIIDLARTAKVNRGTIYNNIGPIEDVYKLVFEKMILESVIDECESFEEIIINFVDYVSDNKTFCMNMYYRTIFVLRHEHIIKLLNNLLIKYDGDNSKSSIRGDLIGGYVGIVENWFKNELSGDSERIKEQLLHYHNILPL